MINRKTILFASLLTAMTLAASCADIRAFTAKSYESKAPHVSDDSGSHESGSEPKVFPGLG